VPNAGHNDLEEFDSIYLCTSGRACSSTSLQNLLQTFLVL
jgi:hypothetical protein